MELQDKVVVITGAAQGIGAGLARRFAREKPAGLVLSDLKAESLEAVAKELAADAFACDVAEESQVEALVEFTMQKFGRVDLFASNAGVTVKGGVETPDEDWRKLWNVNLMSHVYAARAVLPMMLEQGSGYLLQTASAAGLLTEIGSAAYSVTKHAAVSLAEWLSVHYQKQGIKVSCLAPAGVRTEFLDLDDPIHQFLHMSSVSVEEMAEKVVEGIREERFLITSHDEVEEFFQFKSKEYDRWLKNFARLNEKLTRKRE